jgi:hypothetical protein
MIKIANAPCSWGVLKFDLEGEAAGCQQVLDEMVANIQVTQSPIDVAQRPE